MSQLHNIKNQMLHGSPILQGDNTIPGVGYTPEFEELIPQVIQACYDFGIDPYPPICEMLRYDEISEIAAYGGFPVRYPHWSFGMEYEELSRGYEWGMHKIYEMVINSNPSVIYFLDSNTLVDHVTVLAHALGHSDFFKNNAWFEPTTENAVNELATHGTRIRRYMSRYGLERVCQFIDWILSINDLIDFAAAWKRRHAKEMQIKDVKKYHYPRRLRLPESEGVVHDYMSDWINDEAWKDYEKNRIKEKEAMEELDIFDKPERDVMGWLVENAPLRPWQQDILGMLYREAQYFAPQFVTKMLNEGWASYVDYNIMARNHWALGDGIFDYAKHKAGVLGGEFSLNPYSVGFKLFLWVEEKWNKGRFGREYDECEDMDKRRKWDTKAGLGHDKVFEVREVHNDLTAIHQFVDQEFIDKYKIYVWRRFPLPDGGWEYRIESKKAKEVRKMLMKMYSNAGRPDIRLVDPNFANKKIFLLEHQWEGSQLHPRYSQAALNSLWNILNNGGDASKCPVAIASKNKSEEEIVYVCTGNKADQSMKLTRKQFEEQFG